MALRPFILVTHRWMGLLSSAVLAIVGTTGVVLLWAEEIAVLGLVQRFASPLHERLALGAPGWWVVVVSTAVSVLLEMGGLVLWWKRKTLWVRRGTGWRRICFDLHHAVGAVLMPLMLLIAVTGIAMAFFVPGRYPVFYRVMSQLHKGHFPFPIDVLYACASLAFVVQGATGLVMWWKSRRV